MAYLSQIKLSNTTYDVKAKLTEVILNDTSNWRLGLQWRNTTLESGTYLSGIGRHNTGGNSTYPGSISIIPYATNTEPWSGTAGLFLSKDTVKFENQVLLHSGNWSNYCAAASHTHSYLPLSGGTMTGGITYKVNNIDLTHSTNNCTTTQWPTTLSVTDSGDRIIMRVEPVLTANSGTVGAYWYIRNYDSAGNITGQKGIRMNIDKAGVLTGTINGTFTAEKMYGAVWNDYAEFRICNEEFKPGQVVYENGDDTISISNNRLQRGCSIISDTFGFAIGETDEAKCPVAVSGRVLAYGYESREEFKKHIGWPVCSGPNGTVSIMTEEEEEKYPSRIIGTISAVPDYETWGTGNVEVNNRIWIKIK